MPCLTPSVWVYIERGKDGVTYAFVLSAPNRVLFDASVPLRAAQGLCLSLGVWSSELEGVVQVEEV